MKHTRRTRTGLVLATAAAAVLATVAPATAESISRDDGADATASKTDVRQVRITHGTSRVSVRTKFPNVRKRGAAVETVYVDKNPDRRGPEYALSLPLFSGGDYALVRMRRWRATSGPLACDYSVDLRWRRDVAIVKMDRACLGDPDRVRVALVMKDFADEQEPVTDWLGSRRHFTRWLTAGPPAA